MPAVVLPCHVEERIVNLVRAVRICRSRLFSLSVYKSPSFVKLNPSRLISAVWILVLPHRWSGRDVSLNRSNPQLAVAVGVSDQVLDWVVHDAGNTLDLTRLVGGSNRACPALVESVDALEGLAGLLFDLLLNTGRYF